MASPQASIERAGPKRVVIVGGGFAGLRAARELARARSPELEIVLVDRRNHHLFQPLLYQVATAGLSPADISMPIRSILRRYKNVLVRLGEATGVDLDARVLHVDTGDLRYDYLVLAAGATHSYFGHDEWEPHAPGLKTLEQATEIRRRVLTAFELAELCEDPVRRRELLTFVVVGGGPTGVELAGALGELSRHTLGRDFRRIDPGSTRVVLVEGGPRILPAFSPEMSQAASRELERLGVTVWTDTKVTQVHEHGVEVGSESLRAATVLWAAGVRASPLNAGLRGRMDAAGRVEVERDLSLPGRREVFVVGDQARFVGDDGVPVPGLAPAAIQEGETAARNILHDLRGTERESFHYFDKGIMATVGRAAAIVQTGGLQTSGFFAWLTWCFVHILYLIGFRNRVLVLIQWMWSYFRYKRGARLITKPEWMEALPAARLQRALQEGAPRERVSG
jgi:NADH dehydrogenase